ncbi:hypothetical protein HY410_01920 [Candidatus Gottesmanbacteria bacterium]|nr:hypothetical protein [Candidatus Gottesmanbacteria bacterium]
MQIKPKYFLIFALVCILILVFYLATRAGRREEIQIPVVEYRGIRPGLTTLEQTQGVLGAPDRKIETGGSPQHAFLTPEKKAIFVTSDENSTVQIIQEPLGTQASFSDLSRAFGNHDILLYGDYYQRGFRLYVYLQKGTALLANPDTDEAKERWYFQPMALNSFLRLVSGRYSTSPPPEQE